MEVSYISSIDTHTTYKEDFSKRICLQTQGYQFLKIQHRIGPTEINGRSLNEYVHNLRDTNWKLKPIENVKS